MTRWRVLVVLACAIPSTIRAQTVRQPDWPHLEDETMRHFQALLRFDTSNPPGNEVLATDHLKQVLEREGIPVQIFASDPKRPNLVAPLKGDGVRRGTRSAAAAARPGVLQLARPRLRRGAVKWVAPLTADGHPDLQGVWMNNSATPLERPKGLEGKPLLSDEEVAELQRRADRIFGSDDSDAGLGDNVFLAAFANVDRYKFAAATGGALEVDRRVFDNRTSLIVDPPDGRIPYTARGQARRAAQDRARFLDPPSDPEALANEVRCLTYEVPRLRGGGLTYFQIVQSPGYVVLMMESIHETRIIPLQGGPHLPESIRRWSGDSRGHWEGQTLVVDTTNFTLLNNYLGSDENLHLIERFTRIGPEAIDYEMTLDDRTAWTRPWTATLRWKQTTEHIYEVACHEGNYSMTGTLRGARAVEKR